MANKFRKKQQLDEDKQEARHGVYVKLFDILKRFGIPVCGIFALIIIVYMIYLFITIFQKETQWQYLVNIFV